MDSHQQVTKKRTLSRQNAQILGFEPLLSLCLMTVGHEFHEIFQKGPFRMSLGHDLTLNILCAWHFCSGH